MARDGGARGDVLTLTVTAAALPGDRIEDCVDAQITLALKLGANVQVEFNGVSVIATPHAIARDLVADFQRAVAARFPVAMR